jgi:hypothetical protein
VFKCPKPPASQVRDDRPASVFCLFSFSPHGKSPETKAQPTVAKAERNETYLVPSLMSPTLSQPRVHRSCCLTKLWSQHCRSPYLPPPGMPNVLSLQPLACHVDTFKVLGEAQSLLFWSSREQQASLWSRASSMPSWSLLGVTVGLSEIRGHFSPNLFP